MVRHAEKPDSGKDLSVTGRERAHAYAVYFQNYVLNGTLLKLSYIFATADSSQSQRPGLTMEPLAEAMGMKIHAKYQENDYQKVADHILQNSKYDHSNILICWHHGEILELAAQPWGWTPVSCRRNLIGLLHRGRERSSAGCCRFVMTLMEVSFHRRHLSTSSSCMMTMGRIPRLQGDSPRDVVGGVDG